MSIVQLPKSDAPKSDAKNRVLVEFPDDHSIEGAKVEIIGVTPEQIAVAIFHLSRSANMIADARTMNAMQNDAAMREVMANLQRGKV